jgi:hypothetical protein
MIWGVYSTCYDQRPSKIERDGDRNVMKGVGLLCKYPGSSYLSPSVFLQHQLEVYFFLLRPVSLLSLLSNLPYP